MRNEKKLMIDYLRQRSYDWNGNFFWSFFNLKPIFSDYWYYCWIVWSEYEEKAAAEKERMEREQAEMAKQEEEK